MPEFYKARQRGSFAGRLSPTFGKGSITKEVNFQLSLASPNYAALSTESELFQKKAPLVLEELNLFSNLYDEDFCVFLKRAFLVLPFYFYFYIEKLATRHVVRPSRRSRATDTHALTYLILTN